MIVSEFHVHSEAPVVHSHLYSTWCRHILVKYAIHADFTQLFQRERNEFENIAQAITICARRNSP